jgi:tetratricopeptide (TPR) repeat protein
MSGELNVAVAEFGALDAQGAAVQSADARGLADLLFSTLNAELQGINAQTSSASSSEQNFVIQTWGPSQVGRIDGKTPEARADAAEKFATRSKAHLLIYGYLEPRSGAATFVPQFYLTNLKDTPELEGEHDLGASVLMRSLDDPDSKATLRADMTRRTRAFAEFVIGLSQYANDEVADANTHFLRAEADPQWDDSSGKDVLYLFMGYTAGKLGQLDAARGYFEHALKIDPEFARAYLGLGEVRFQESLGKPEACARDSVDVAGMQDAIQLYQRSLSAKVQPDRSNVPSTTALGLGRAYLCLSQADAADHWADAERLRQPIGHRSGGRRALEPRLRVSTRSLRSGSARKVRQGRRAVPERPRPEPASPHSPGLLLRNARVYRYPARFVGQRQDSLSRCQPGRSGE